MLANDCVAPFALNPFGPDQLYVDAPLAVISNPWFKQIVESSFKAAMSMTGGGDNVMF